MGHSLYQCALQSSLKVWWHFKNSVTLNVRHKWRHFQDQKNTNEMRFDTIEDKALVYYLILVKNKTGVLTEKKAHWGLFQIQSQTPTLGLNTRPWGQSFGCGTPQEHWQNSGLQGSWLRSWSFGRHNWPVQPCLVCIHDVVVSSCKVTVFLVEVVCWASKLVFCVLL